MRLKGKVCLITGAAGGIGGATARVFVREGAALMLVDKDRASVQRVLDEVKNLGASAFFIQGDVTDFSFAEKAVQETVDQFGRLDVLFNNAGIFFESTAEETSIEDFKRLMEINVFSVFYFSRAAIPVMRLQGGGVIINNASDWALVGGPRGVAYCSSKGAVVQMTRAMALDHARQGIRINAICPGDTITPLQEDRARSLGADFEEYKAALGNALPIGRMAEPEEIAKPVLFLASDDASFITGAILAIDGGNTCQ